VNKIEMQFQIKAKVISHEIYSICAFNNIIIKYIYKVSSSFIKTKKNKKIKCLITEKGMIGC
jgi:hypothetical protein